MTIDLTGLAVSVIAASSTILSVVLPMVINSRVKDAQAAATLSAAVKNSLGAIQQQSVAVARGLRPAVLVPPGVPPDLAAGVQYVVDHAGEEAARFGITPVGIASKISAQIGLAIVAQKVNGAVGTAPGPLPATGAVVPLPAAGSAAAGP